MTAIQQFSSQVTALLIVILQFSVSAVFRMILFPFRAVYPTGAFLKASTTNPSRDDALEVGDGPLGCPNDIPDPDLDDNLGFYRWQHSTPYVSLYKNKKKDIGSGKIPVRNNKFFINGTEDDDDDVNAISTMLEDVTLQDDRDSSCSTPFASAPTRNRFFFNGVDANNNNSNVGDDTKNDADDTVIVDSSSPSQVAPIDKYSDLQACCCGMVFGLFLGYFLYYTMLRQILIRAHY